MKPSKTIAFVLVASCGLVHSARATLLFSEGFNYTAGNSLAGQMNPGSGTEWEPGNSGMTIGSGRH